MRARHLYLIALVIVALDQVTKLAVVNSLPIGSSIPVIGGLVHFTSVRNPGGAFGMMQSSTGLLTVVTIATVIGIVLWMRRGRRLPVLPSVAVALLLGGAVGNLIDRVRLHHVIDFIDLRVWPVFNLADSAITVAVFALGYYLLFGERHQLEATGRQEN